jgi:hypothetical protein
MFSFVVSLYKLPLISVFEWNHCGTIATFSAFHFTSIKISQGTILHFLYLSQSVLSTYQILSSMISGVTKSAACIYRVYFLSPSSFSTQERIVVFS